MTDDPFDLLEALLFFLVILAGLIAGAAIIIGSIMMVISNVVQ